MPFLIGAAALAVISIIAVASGNAEKLTGAMAAAAQQARGQGGAAGGERGNTGADTVGQFLGNDTRGTSDIPFLNSIFMPPPPATMAVSSAVPQSAAAPMSAFTPGPAPIGLPPDIPDPIVHANDSAFSPVMSPTEINPAARP